MLQYTYIVEEEDIINECYRFMKKQWRRLLRRIAYLCCCTCMFRVGGWSLIAPATAGGHLIISCEKYV